MIDSLTSSPASFALGEELNLFINEATKKETQQLTKIQDEVANVDARISALGELRTKLNDLSDAVFPLNINSLSQNSVFQAKKVIVKEKITNDYAKISAFKDTPDGYNRS